jgi:hypothetical protein
MRVVGSTGVDSAFRDLVESLAPTRLTYAGPGPYADDARRDAVIEEGRPAPTFTLPSAGGDDVPLESFRGKPVVLHLDPRDDALPPFDSMSA